MIAIDTNLLVFAHRGDSPWHARALAAITELAESGQPWAIPWPCVHEFLVVTTNPRLWKEHASSPKQAISAIDAWLKSTGVVMISEGPAFYETFHELVEATRVAGPVIHDAKIAAICLTQGIELLWTADEDFKRFPRLRTYNPLLPAADR